MPNAVEQLAELVGWRGAGDPSIAWEEVERRLELPVPSDYKAFAGRFPYGEFWKDLILTDKVLYEGSDDLIAGSWVVLEDLRRWRRAEPRLVPHPIYPERAGLVPCGSTASGATLFWITEGGDPEVWPVVLADASGERWDRFGGGAVQFVLTVARGEFRSPLLKPVATPSFEPFATD